LADVSKVINDADQWLFGKLGEQSKLTKTDNPAVTVAEIQSKASELEKACKKILSTPKPASAPAPESEKKDSKPKEGERESADASKTAMDVDSAEAPAAEGDKMNVD
jgi:hypoxia up-regulated 1